LKLKASKCKLFQRKVGFLGHVVSSDGIEPDPEKVKSVTEWPVPRNVSEVRAFVGLASYYRRHVKGFADIARPLHELTRKNEAFVWNERRQAAFDALKRCLVSAPVLAAPLDSGQYLLDTDASETGLAAVLQQEQPNGVTPPRVIAYASRALSKAELSYCTTRKELLAVIYGLKQFRQHLLAREFVIRTDHAALTHLRRTPDPIRQQARWLDLIGEYNFTIQHRSGEANRNADGLSRRPCERNDLQDCKQCQRKNVTRFRAVEISCEDNSEEDTVVKCCDTEVASASDNQLSTSGAVCAAIAPAESERSVDADVFAKDALREAQDADEIIAPVKIWLSKSASWPDWKLLENHSDDVRTLWAQFESLELRDNVLYRRFYKTLMVL